MDVSRGFELRPVKGDKMPSLIACVNTETRRETRTIAGREYTMEVLFHWELESWRVENGERKRVRRVEGNTPSEFWRAFDLLPKSDTVLWVFGFHVGKILTDLEFWDRLETGQCYLGEVDHWDVQMADPGGRESGANSSTVSNTEIDAKCPVPANRPRGYLVLEDPPTIVHHYISSKKGSIKWIDLRNYGLSHSQKNSSFSAGIQATTSALNTILTCCQGRSLGSWQATAGSQSWFAWRRRGYRGGLIIHNNPQALNIERAAYYGGRNEVYQIDPIKGPVYHLDVNSLYGAVATNAGMPVELLSVGTGYNSCSVWTGRPNTTCIAKVLLNTSSPLFPMRSNDNLIFPVGSFWTVLAGDELLLASKMRCIAEIAEWAVYDLANLFGNWPEKLYAIRMEGRRFGNKALEDYGKALLVTLFGRFAQRRYSWRSCYDRVGTSPFSVWQNAAEVTEYRLRSGQGSGVNTEVSGGIEPLPTGRYRSVAWHVQREMVAGETETSFPGVAAVITGLARIRLMQLIAIAGSDCVYYVDTDSIWCSRIGFERLQTAGEVDPDKMGKLKIVGVHNEVEFFGQKHYVADGKLTCAGLPKEDAVRVASGYECWQRDALRSELASGHPPRGIVVNKNYGERSADLTERAGSSGRVYPHVITIG